MLAHTQNGSSLIEMVAVIVIVGIVFATGALIVDHGLVAFNESERVSSVTWQARVALDRIDREVRMVRAPAAADLGLASGALTFTTLRGTQYSYALVGQSLEQSVNGGTPQVIAKDVTHFGVRYWESDGATPAVSAALVHYVGVSLTVAAAGTQVKYEVLMDMRDFS